MTGPREPMAASLYQNVRMRPRRPNSPYPTSTQNKIVTPPVPACRGTEAYRISCHASLDKATCASFRKEGRMKCINTTKFHRKSGGAEWSDLQFYGPFLEMFSVGAIT